MRRIIILVGLLLISCGSRKSTVESEVVKQKTDIIQVDSSKLVKNNVEKVIDTTQEEECEYEPIDPKLPMIINGKEYKNTKFKTKKTKKGISILKKENSVLNQTKSTKYHNSLEKNNFKKHTERESSNWWWLIILILFGIGLGYYEYKR